MAIIPTDCIPALAWEGRLRFFLYLLTAGGYVKGRNERELKKMRFIKLTGGNFLSSWG